MFAETAKLAYADRDAYYGDVPDVPLSRLLDDDYLRARRALVGQAASGELRPGSVGGREPRMPELARMAVAQTLPRADTCHIDVADCFGNLIAVAPSGGFMMTSPVIEPLGFPLGTRLEMTWLDEGLPNTLRPRRRPRTTLTPTLALRDGEPTVAFGSPGADQQEQWSLGFFLALAAGDAPQQAIDRVRWHTDHLISSLSPHEFHPRRLATETRMPDSVLRGLAQLGHDVVTGRPAETGRITAAGRDLSTGLLFAAADARGRQNYACGR